MTTFLRVTRWLVSLIVSIHVFLLRLTTTFADRAVAKKQKKVEQAKSGVEFARQALSYAQLSVREFNDEHRAACKAAKETRMAADAECQFYGRSL